MAEGMCGRGHAWQGMCIAGGIHGREGAYMAGDCMAGGCVAGDMHGRGHVWWGACMAGGHAWQERWPLQQAVHILLECILVFS